MTVITFGNATARGLHRLASAIHAWIETRTPRATNSIPIRRDALRMPPCVWYGRSVFCFHLPSETSAAEESER